MPSSILDSKVFVFKYVREHTNRQDPKKFGYPLKLTLRDPGFPNHLLEEMSFKPHVGE